MTLRLMYITNRPAVAIVAEVGGVDMVFVDLEILGKQSRQGHLDTVISKHTIEDVYAIRSSIAKADLLVRTNPIHDGSAEEIDRVIDAGADIVMLPYFTSREEVATFVKYVGDRAQVCLLLETPAAVDNLEEILRIGGIDLVHIGLNDLHLGYGQHFMFQPLIDGTVERVCERLGRARIPYGFGGIARLGQGALPAEAIIAEHHRLGSSMAILSRSFCDMRTESDPSRIAHIFSTEVARIRDFEASLATVDETFFVNNRTQVVRGVRRIVAEKVAHAEASSSERVTAEHAVGRS